MNPHVTPTSRFQRRIQLARVTIALLVASAFVLVPQVLAAGQPNKRGSAHTSIILQHHTHAKSTAHTNIILQHHHH